MKIEKIEKCDKDRKTILNTCDVRIPETWEELTKWELSPDATEMEKYIFGRKFEDWKKGVCVTIASKIDNRKKGIDPEDKKMLDAIKKQIDPQMREINRKMIFGETLTDSEKKIITSLLGKHSQK